MAFSFATRAQTRGMHGLLRVQHRLCSSSKAEPSQKQKEVIGRGGVVALLVAAPAFAYAGYIALRSQPEPVKGVIVGTWYSADGGSRLRFNSMGVCEYTDLDGKSGKAPAGWTSASASDESPAVGTLAIGFPYFTEPTELSVQAWPHITTSDIPLQEGVSIPQGSTVMELGGQLWMRA